MSSKKKSLIIFSVVILILLVFLILFFFWQNNSFDNQVKSDLNLEGNVSSDVLYESERGFGGDAFDIYQFRVDNWDSISNGKMLDDTYSDQKKRFKDFLELNIKRNKDAEINETVLENLSHLEDLNATAYYYLENRECKIFCVNKND